MGYEKIKIELLKLFMKKLYWKILLNINQILRFSQKKCEKKNI